MAENRMERQEQDSYQKLHLVNQQQVKRIIEAGKKIKTAIKQVDEIVEQTIKQIKKLKQQTVQLVKNTVYADLLKKQQKITPQFLQNLEKIGKLDLPNIRMLEMRETISKIDNSRVSNVYQKVGKITQNFKYNIQFNKRKGIILTAEEPKFKESIINSQNSSFLKKLNLQQNKYLQVKLDNSSTQQDSNDSIYIQSFQKDRQSSYQKQELSIIEKLRQSKFSEQSLESFFQQKKSNKLQISNFDSVSEDQRRQKKSRQNRIINDWAQQQKKQHKDNRKGNNRQKKQDQPEEVKAQKMKPRKYVKKKISQQQQQTQETFYVKLKDVEAEKGKFEAENRKFNIKLKVLKIIGYTVTKEDKLNIKFVGGDETGIVVCFVHYTQLIQQGAIVKMETCILNYFKNMSYEIMSNKISRAPKSTKIDKIQYLRSISKFQNVRNLEYQLASLAGWPTIRGLGKFYLNNKYKQKNCFSLIAKILLIFPNIEQSNFLDCIITDGTATMTAKIHEQAIEQPKEGELYHVKNVGIMIQQVGLKDVIYVNITKKNQPKKLKQNIVIKEQQLKCLEQIIEQLKKARH